MDKSKFVDIFNSIDKLLHNDGVFELLQKLVLIHVIKKISLVQHFSNDVNVIFGEVFFNESDYAGMMAKLQNFAFHFYYCLFVQR